eukprot:3717104-Amphidinium_carterae.1
MAKRPEAEVVQRTCSARYPVRSHQKEQPGTVMAVCMQPIWYRGARIEGHGHICFRNTGWRHSCERWCTKGLDQVTGLRPSDPQGESQHFRGVEREALVRSGVE